MYSSGYSQVSKHSPQAKKKMQYRSSSKSCGYYMRIVFFFSSLIQSLIIVSLVLFLVYGKTQDSTCQERTQDLEERFSQISLENVALKKQRTNLTNFLNVTLTAKARLDSDLTILRQYTNMSILYLHECDQKQVRNWAFYNTDIFLLCLPSYVLSNLIYEAFIFLISKITDDRKRWSIHLQYFSQVDAK